MNSGYSILVSDSLAQASDSLVQATDSLAQASDSLVLASDSLAQASDSLALPFNILDVHTTSSAGEMGMPRPYNLRGDNMISVTLILCFMLFVLSLAFARRLILQQVKDFFRESHGEQRDYHSLLSPFLLFLVIVDCMMVGICSYVMADDLMPGDFILEKQILNVGIFSAMFMAYLLVKWIAYNLVNEVFFGSKKRLQWNATFLFVTALEGVLLFPLILLLVYFNLSIHIALYFIIFVLFLNKILTFYKATNIFFLQNARYLQIFLYFCALEIAPLLAFGGIWFAVVNLLKVNF